MKPSSNRSPRDLRFGLIGNGRIGAAVASAWTSGQLPGWQLAGVLVRTVPAQAAPWLTADRAVFLASSPDVIVEVAGPAALREHAVAALSVAEVWTVSAAALADELLMAEVIAACAASGRRLRVLPGAMAGLDAVAAAAVDPWARLSLDVELLPGDEPAAELFAGSVREAAHRFPGSVNVAAAAALAGPGLDASRIRVSHPGPVARNRLALTAESHFGTVSAEVRPRMAPGVHPVAASVVAALRQRLAPVWVG